MSVARVGVEVGTVAHDVGFVVLDVVDDHGVVASALYSAHAGLDLVGLIEGQEVKVKARM